MKDIYIITHTESRHHVDRLVGGWFDTSLTKRGQRQARLVADRVRTLIGQEVPQLVSSDLMRASQTAKAIGDALGTAARLDPDLREMSYGSAGGRPQVWMAEHEHHAPRAGDRMNHRSVPDGESRREFAIRVYRAMARVIENPAPVHVLVTHGFTLTFLVAAWVEMPLDATGYINLRASTGGITHLRQDDIRFNRAVLNLNMVSHLAEVDC